MSNIPNHTTRPPLPPTRRLLLLVFAFSPVVGYTVLKYRNKSVANQRRLEEEEGRKSWIEHQDGQSKETGRDSNGKSRDLGVGVGRSGGGV